MKIYYLIIFIFSLTVFSNEQFVLKINEDFVNFGEINNQVNVSMDCLGDCKLVEKIRAIKSRDQFFVDGKNPNVLLCIYGIEGDLAVGEKISNDGKLTSVQLCVFEGSFIYLSDILKITN